MKKIFYFLVLLSILVFFTYLNSKNFYKTKPPNEVLAEKVEIPKILK